MRSTVRPALRGRRLKRVLFVMTCALLLVGLVRAWRLRWVCDDAFISFRYADNLVAGHGLVWNVGERVEGYTNLLWTLILAGASALKLDLVWTSQLLGVASLATVILAAWRLSARWSGKRALVPVTVWVLLLMEDVLVWATGGLETMTAAAFAAVMTLLLFGPTKPSAARELWAGAVGSCLVLIRADGALLAGTLGCAYIYAAFTDWREATKRALCCLGPVIAAACANVAFRLVYYGDWLPNTYYAKSAGQGWWGQGLAYVGFLAWRNHVLVWVVLLAIGLKLVEQRRAHRGRPLESVRADRVSGALVFSTLVFVLYVARSGGDFMFARRLVPVVPLLLLAFDRTLAQLRSEAWKLGLGVLLAAAAALPYPLFQRQAQTLLHRGVVDEHGFYTLTMVAKRRRQGIALREAFHGIDTYVLIEGGLCMVAYYSGLPHVMEINGLTEPRIAKQRIEQRGVPGHEKGPSAELLDELKVTFLVRQMKRLGGQEVDTVTVGDGLLDLKILYWDDAVMAALRGRDGVRFHTPDAQYANVELRMRRADCARAEQLFSTFDRYYLRWHGLDNGWRDALATLRAERCAGSHDDGGLRAVPIPRAPAAAP